MKKIIDLSHTISNQSPVYPGDQPVVIETVKHFNKDGYHLSKVTCSMHVGTHIDAPKHLSASTTTMDQFDLDVGIGRGVVLDVRGQREIIINQQQLNQIDKNDIVLLYTGWDQYYHNNQYVKHPVLSFQSAQALLKKEIAMLGMDMPSPDQYPFDIHHLLLTHDIWLIENMTNLKYIKDCMCHIYAIPIKIEAEAALARVFAVVFDQ